MTGSPTAAYRQIVRELRKASIFPRATRNKAVASGLRTAVEKRIAGHPDADWHLANLVTFMRSQRTHKELLERYNPLVDLTAEERIEATARRVGLNMPVEPEKE